ncbi:unnamed protein product [Rhizophagus irregularis]|nr:unnamed protein product [Rhizophagus irregularis]
MKYGVSKVKIPGEVLAANCLEQTRGTSAKSADQLPPPIAWNRHEQLLATKRFITSPPIAWNRHEVWLLQGKYTKGSSRRQLPGTDTKTSA